MPLTVADAVDRSSGLIFDLFHTLAALEDLPGPVVHTNEILGLERGAWNRALLEHSRWRLVGEERDPAVIIGRMARAIDPAVSDERIARAVAHRSSLFVRALAATPPRTVAVLTALRARGKRIGLCSNADVLETAGWPASPLAGLFDSVVFSCEVGAAKPEAAIYRASLDGLGLTAPACLFIGDGGSGELAGARAMGLRTVLMAGYIELTMPGLAASRRADADFRIDDIAELLPPHERP